jgi:hypothetical protein
MAVVADSHMHAATDRVHMILRELREKYRIERSELVAAVTEQVGDVRAELEVALESNRECTRALGAVQRQLATMASDHDGPADLAAQTNVANAKLAVLDETSRRMSEEVQLLTTAVMNDRIRREERQRRSEADDAEAELRLRHIEESNAAVRSELQLVKSVNVEAMSAVAELVQECKYDAPTLHDMATMQRLRESVLHELHELRTSSTAARAKVSAAIKYCEDAEHHRARNVESLEVAVKEIQQRPPLPRVPVELSVHRLETAFPQDGLVYTPRQTASSGREPWRPPDLRTRVASFYADYNPSKLRDLDRVLQEYTGAEEELLSALEVHYGAFGYFSAH